MNKLCFAVAFGLFLLATIVIVVGLHGWAWAMPLGLAALALGFLV